MVPFISGIKLARESENMSWSLGVTDSQSYEETHPNRRRSEQSEIGGGDGKGEGIGYNSKRGE